MELPIQITFHQLERSEAVAENVREHAQRLEKYFDGIVACRITIEAPHHHHASDNQFRVRIEASVPGDKLIASREPDKHHAYTDVYVAIRDAFDAMRRQLEDYSSRLRGEVKHHERAS